jgi:CHASE3 domain sensor protein
VSSLRPHSRLTARIVAIVVGGALVVGAGVAVLLNDTVTLRRSAASAQNAAVYASSVVNVERLVVDAETGLRGAVITGRVLFLEPTLRAQRDLPRALEALRRTAAQDNVYLRQTDDLIAAVRSYMSSYVPSVIGQIAHDLPKARSFAVTLEGKRLVDGTRGRVATLERLLSSSQTAREQTAHDVANRSIADSIVILALLTLFTVLLGGYLGRLVVARERERDRSEATTRTLQQSILPSAVPEIPGCELATRFIPGGGAVSGDFYDVLELDDDEWALIIGDVCGKGATAAAATAMARWTLRTSLSEGADPVDALRLLNSLILRYRADGQFITAVCVKVRLDPGSAHLVVASAGHPAPVLVPSHGAPVTVAAHGDLLGIMPTIRLRSAELLLQPGDSLVVYTDGVTDQGPEVRRSPEQALAERAQDGGAHALARILADLATDPGASHPDDVAIIALRFLGRRAPSAPLKLAATGTQA